MVLQVGHDKRRQTANRRIKELIDSGELGHIVMVETHQNVPMALKFASDYWRSSREESPLGSMTSLGVHMLDTMHYLLGPVDRVFAFSRSGVVPDAPPIDHVTSMVLQFESGQQGYLGTSFVVPPTVSVTVRGTGGTVSNEENGAKLLRQTPGSMAREIEDIVPNDPIADEVAEFARSIKGGAQPETGGAEGLEVISVFNAAIASSESGKAESVADFR